MYEHRERGRDLWSTHWDLLFRQKNDRILSLHSIHRLQTSTTSETRWHVFKRWYRFSPVMRRRWTLMYWILYHLPIHSRPNISTNNPSLNVGDRRIQNNHFCMSVSQRFSKTLHQNKGLFFLHWSIFNPGKIVPLSSLSIYNALLIVRRCVPFFSGNRSRKTTSGTLVPWVYGGPPVHGFRVLVLTFLLPRIFYLKSLWH